MNARQRKMVYIEESDGGGSCTGTLVDDDTVLTAAHCLWDYDNEVATSSSFKVCDYGNSNYNGSSLDATDIDCASGTAVVPFGYTVWGDFGSDYALLQLSDPFQNDGWMPMWSGSSGDILDHTSYNIGYPQAAGDYCAWPTEDTSEIDSVESGHTSVGWAAARTWARFGVGLSPTCSQGCENA